MVPSMLVYSYVAVCPKPEPYRVSICLYIESKFRMVPVVVLSTIPFDGSDFIPEKYLQNDPARESNENKLF